MKTSVLRSRLLFPASAIVTYVIAVWDAFGDLRILFALAAASLVTIAAWILSRRAVAVRAGDAPRSVPIRPLVLSVTLILLWLVTLSGLFMAAAHMSGSGYRTLVAGRNWAQVWGFIVLVGIYWSLVLRDLGTEW